MSMACDIASNRLQRLLGRFLVFRKRPSTHSTETCYLRQFSQPFFA
jgi:hypothetical protein